MSELSRTLSTDAIVARDAFRGMMETLSNSEKKYAVQLVLHSIVPRMELPVSYYYSCILPDCSDDTTTCIRYYHEVIELIIQKMENEPSMSRRVELLFVVDSITQLSQKDTAGACFVPIIEAQLPRLLLAAAPHGVGAPENHRQSVKVLRLWIERKIFPESYLQPYIDNIELSMKKSSPADRDVDGRAREIGMLVKKCGSNVTPELPAHFDHSRVLVQEELHVPSYKQDVLVHQKEKEDFSRECKGFNRVSQTLGGGSPILSSQPSQPVSSPCSPNFLFSPKPQLPPIFPPSPHSIGQFSPPSPPNSPPQDPPLPSSPPPVVPPPPPSDNVIQISHPTMQNLSYPPQQRYGQGYETIKPRVSIPPPSLPGPSTDFTFLSTTAQKPPCRLHEPLPNSIAFQPPSNSGRWPPLERQLAGNDTFQPVSVNLKPLAPGDCFQTAGFNTVAYRPPTPASSRDQPMMWYGQRPTSHDYSKLA